MQVRQTVEKFAVEFILVLKMDKNDPDLNQLLNALLTSGYIRIVVISDTNEAQRDQDVVIGLNEKKLELQALHPI